jgi:tetratricopeptide (TPR) repeat protein
MANDAMHVSVPKKTKQTYLSRHWLGQLSLAKTFWLNTILLGLIMWLAIFVAVVITSLAFENQYGARAVAILLGSIPAMVTLRWAVVGAWRSARDYSGARIWKVLTRLALGVWGLCISVFWIGASITFVASYFNELGIIADKGIEFLPPSANAHVRRGIAYYNVGEYDHAISNYTKAIEINPKLGIAYYLRGHVYLTKKHERDRAIADYQRGSELGDSGSSAALEILRSYNPLPKNTPRK